VGGREQRGRREGGREGGRDDYKSYIIKHLII
jgi:hypothetical protein